MNERYAQGLLMEEMLHRKHVIAVPNSRYLSLSEADVLTVTPARLVNEFEIKLSRADFLAEFRTPTGKHRSYRKTHKHRALKWAYDGSPISRHTPNYYWFVTYEVDIADDVPEYAGWLEMVKTRKGYDFNQRVAAPRLHTVSIDEKDILKMARILSYRVMTDYKRKQGKVDNG